MKLIKLNHQITLSAMLLLVIAISACTKVESSSLPKVSNIPSATTQPITSSPVVANQSTNSTVKLAIATAKPYPRRPLKLEDQAKPGSSFYEFRQQVRQAASDRNAKFIRQIADPNIKLTFGRPKPLKDLNIDKPNALFWQYLERAISTGCAPQENVNQPSSTQAWVCPHVSQASLGDPFTDVYIVSTGVNVRAEPRRDSAVVGVLSHEVVQVDNTGLNNFSTEQRQAIETWDGWYPVITPQGQRGYVSSRYVFLPAGYRAIFDKTSTGWKMTAFIAGD